MNRNVMIALSVVLLLGGFALAAKTFRAKEAEHVGAIVAEQSKTLVPDHAMRLGNKDAKVVVVEFFDPACETCAQFAPIIKDMVEQSDGKVQVIERYAPLHTGSKEVVALLEASRKQNLYWETLDLLFTTQSAWTAHHAADMSKVFALLEQAGYDIAALNTGMQDPAIAALIAQDIKDSQTLGVKATPEFFVNGKPLPEWGLAQLKALVKSETERLYGG